MLNLCVLSSMFIIVSFSQGLFYRWHNAVSGFMTPNSLFFFPFYVLEAFELTLMQRNCKKKLPMWILTLIVYNSQNCLHVFFFFNLSLFISVWPNPAGWSHCKSSSDVRVYCNDLSSVSVLSPGVLSSTLPIHLMCTVYAVPFESLAFSSLF